LSIKVSDDESPDHHSQRERPASLVGASAGIDSAWPVTIVILPFAEEDDTGQAWASGVVSEWADELR
jgi:hypothetical protein